MKILVQKFGGSSLKDLSCVEKAAAIVAEARSHGNAVVAVASASGDTTDKLLGMCAGFDLHNCGRELDMLLATGEQASASLLAMAVSQTGCGAQSFTGGQAGITTDKFFGAASILKVKPDMVLRCLKEGKVAVVAGYQGMCSGEITTLGRGGSDTTAVALAQALSAQYCDIYTDVDGVYSVDPRLSPLAKRLEKVSFAQMLAMAKGGARVMNVGSMVQALSGTVPVRVRSTESPGDCGTLIGGDQYNLDFCGIAVDHCSMFLIDPVDSLIELGAVQKLLRQLRESGVSAEVVHRLSRRQIQGKIYLAVSKNHLHDSQKLLRNLGHFMGLKITYLHDLSKISVVGNFPNAEHAGQKVVSQLLANGVCPIYFGRDRNRLLALVLPSAIKKSVQILHDGFASQSHVKDAEAVVLGVERVTGAA